MKDGANSCLAESNITNIATPGIFSCSNSLFEEM